MRHRLAVAALVALVLASGCGVRVQGVGSAPPEPASGDTADREAAAREAEAQARARLEAEARARQEAAQAEAAARRAEAPATAAPPPAARPPVDSGSGYAMVRVFYATDRAGRAGPFEQAAPAERYTGARGVMNYGHADVSIPSGHRAGELEAPSWLRLEFSEDPAEHVVLLTVERMAREPFLRALQARVAASEGGNAFLFVHGYNVSFADAARRTAQMSYDLAFDGAPVFFSWPSQGALSGYTVDESNIEWSTPHIKRFLADVARHSDAGNLYLIAHSMGNRGLTRALQQLMAEQPALRGRFREIILAAPDVDAAVFRRELVPALRQAGRRVTLYASSNDLALKASKEVHGYARAGDSGDGLVVMRGLDTIDASGVDESVLAHSYFVESGPVVRDILQLLKEGRGAHEREGLQAQDTPVGRFWRFATGGE